MTVEPIFGIISIKLNVNWRETLVAGSMLGNLRVVKRLGSGGMAEVFLAEAPDGGFRAVKVLDPSVSGSDSEFLERFRHEAEFAQRTRHPNLVEVDGAARDPSTGLCYLVMEYMPGGSLRDVLNANPKGLSIDGVLSVAKDIARALVLLEENGMVHRDVKPDNILFTADGVAKLTDLGISRFSKTETDVHATRASAVIGTPAYMAPEQMLDSHAVDIRADIYSFGMMLYELLTGHRPNEGEGAMRTLAKAIEGQAFPDVRHLRPDTPAELAVLVSEMTLPDADQRPPSASFVLELLKHPDRIPTGDESGSPQDAPPSVPWYRDRGVLLAATAMALALEALVLAIFKAIRGG